MKDAKAFCQKGKSLFFACCIKTKELFGLFISDKFQPSNIAVVRTKIPRELAEVLRFSVSLLLDAGRERGPGVGVVRLQQPRGPTRPRRGLHRAPRVLRDEQRGDAGSVRAASLHRVQQGRVSGCFSSIRSKVSVLCSPTVSNLGWSSYWSHRRCLNHASLRTVGGWVTHECTCMCSFSV